MTRFLLRAVPALLLTLILTTPALAHRVNIFAWAEGGTIYTESKFQGGNKVAQAAVEVRDANTGALLLTGSIDAGGKWSFPVPAEFRDAKPDLLIVIKAGEGHQGQWKLPAADYLDSGAAPAPAAAEAPAAAPQAETPATAPVDSAALEQTVNRLVEAKIGPLRKELAEAGGKGPGAAEILGGLGFLMGLAGMVMASRRRKG